MPRYIDFKAVKAQFNITDALKHYGYLEHMEELADGSLRGACPIHSVNHRGRSFKVTPSKQGFNCFGCGAKGNVLDLVGGVEGISRHSAALLIDQWLTEESVEADREEQVVASPQEQYRAHLYSNVPIYSSQLVRETSLDVEYFERATMPEMIFSILQPYFETKDREEFVCVLLDMALHVIGIVPVAVGSRNAAIVDPVMVFKPAILANAASIIVSHNHPSGSLEPSRADIAITEKLKEAGEILDIPVLDHIIVGTSTFQSIAA